jgi:hypothetical protein
VEIGKGWRGPMTCHAVGQFHASQVDANQFDANHVDANHYTALEFFPPSETAIA